MINIAYFLFRWIDTSKSFEREGDVRSNIITRSTIVAKKRWRCSVDPKCKCTRTIINDGEVGFLNVEVARGIFSIDFVIIRFCILF